MTVYGHTSKSPEHNEHRWRRSWMHRMAVVVSFGAIGACASGGNQSVSQQPATSQRWAGACSLAQFPRILPAIGDLVDTLLLATASPRPDRSRCRFSHRCSPVYGVGGVGSGHDRHSAASGRRGEQPATASAIGGAVGCAPCVRWSRQYRGRTAGKIRHSPGLRLSYS